MGPAARKSQVVAKRPRVGVVRKLGEGATAQMSSTSSDRRSKVRGPSQNSPRIASKRCGIKRPPAGVVRKFGMGMPAQMSPTSSDRGSKSRAWRDFPRGQRGLAASQEETRALVVGVGVQSVRTRRHSICKV
ncbi:hypothetical protein AVEN_86842-1 [Araneus ventricosus]|uniref:Uncharacterized protein n=1 Tax=Araneus ventricosus TaxID=182803 RepID=A0A4Y2CZV4_ARAVE|nr:hypothetical protein AVEN_86842-1 [Araneus ventricosus]